LPLICYYFVFILKQVRKQPVKRKEKKKQTKEKRKKKKDKTLTLLPLLLPFWLISHYHNLSWVKD